MARQLEVPSVDVFQAMGAAASLAPERAPEPAGAPRTHLPEPALELLLEFLGARGAILQVSLHQPWA